MGHISRPCTVVVSLLLLVVLVFITLEFQAGNKIDFCERRCCGGPPNPLVTPAVAAFLNPSMQFSDNDSHDLKI